MRTQSMLRQATAFVGGILERCGGAKMEAGGQTSHPRRRAAFLPGLLLLALAGIPDLPGATVTLNPASDAYVNDSDPAGTFNNAWLVAGRSPAEFTPRYRAFLRFNLGSIPSNAIVSSALLRLNLQTYESTSPATIGVRRVLAAWSSGTLTWNNQPALTATPLASTAVGSVIGADYQWTVTGLVQDWLEGQFANNGLALVITNESTATATRTFASLNHTNNALRPELVVTYVLPADIAVTPPTLAFGNQLVGATSAVQNVTVLNNGGSTLWISNVTSSSSQFRIEGTPPFPASLGPGANGVFQVLFAPTSVGAKNGTVTISSNDPDEPGVPVSCTGTGIAPDINLSPTTLAFGNQLVGIQSATQTVTIQNTGSADLHVSSISSSSGQFLLTLGASLPATIAPGSNLLFGVRFAPTSVGLKSGSVTVSSDDPDESTRMVSCTGTGVVPDIDLVPTSLNFGNQLVGIQSATQTVTIQNTGSADLHVSSISSSSGQFLLTLGASLPATIAPGSNLLFGVRFAPTSVGLKSGSVTVSSDDPDESTRMVSCTGTGVVPDIDLAPTSLNFGNQLLGTTSAPQIVTIQNTGSADLHLISIHTTNSEFMVSLDASLPVTIAPGGNLPIEIRFSPVNPGIRNICITFLSDDPDEPARDLTCTGLGVVPDIDLVPTSLNFGNQLLGTTSAPQIVTIQNTGSANLHLASIQTTNSEFTVSLGTSLPATIIPEGGLPVEVRFAPTRVGVKTGRIILRSDDPDEPEIHLDYSGKGVLPPMTNLTLTPQLPAKLEVQLDRLVYDAADSISAMLLVRDGQLAAEQLGLVLAGSQSRDVEVIPVRRSADGLRYVPDAPVPIALLAEGEVVRPLDQVLTLRPGEMFFAIYYTNPGRDHAVLNGEDLVVDFATLADPTANALIPQIIPELALTDDERVPIVGAKRMGTITHAGGLPLQIATEELILRPRDSQQLAAFLAATGGQVVLTDLLRQEQPGRTQPNYYLVRVNPAAAKLDLLPNLQALAGRRTKLIASSEGALRICALALEHRLNGFDVGVNARLQFMDRPLWTPDVAPFRDDITARSFRWQPFEIQKVWSFMALWDKDLNRVPVAFLDQGFSPNSDFRPPLAECDMAGANLVEGFVVDFTCNPGDAVSPPTTGNSFFGDKSWHGNGVVTVAGGIVNNGYGAAGTGGQVVDPMLYRFDAVSYVFETGLGIRQATLDGAAVINISAAYPCSILTTFGIGFDVCDPIGRAELCLAVETALVVAAGAVCGLAAEVAAFAVLFPETALDATVACIEANLAVALAVPACVALVALGDVREPMEDAVAFALGRGVTIVACAGNRIDRDKLPEVIRPFIDLDNIDVSDWQMIPAVIPGVLCVGAIEWTDPDGTNDGPGFWANAHFNGDRVDIWAPIESRYYAPITTDAVEPDPTLHEPDLIGGTSAATPYISGLIANLIAIDPTLNRLNNALTPAQRNAIPGLVRSLLVDNATTLLPEGETVVAPLATVQAAAAAVLPAFAKDYDDSINFSESSPEASHDLPATAFDLGILNDAAHPVEQTGTILTIPGLAPSGVDYTDEDWFSFAVPDVSAAWPAGLYQTTILLYTPAADTFGSLSISGQGFSEGNHAWAPPSANESVREFLSPLLFNGGSNRFRVHNDGAGSDNVYFVRAFTGWAAPPPDGDRFDQDNENNRSESRPNNNLRSQAVHLGEDNDEFAWQIVPGPDARYPESASITIPDLSFHNAADRDCFQIVHLPPYEFYDPPGCQPRLLISWEPDLQLEILAPDTGEVLFTIGRSPAEIPAEFVFEDMILRLQAGDPGEYLIYSLTLTFLASSEFLCGFPDDGGGSGWEGGADGGGPFFFPQYRPMVTDVTALAAYRRGFAEMIRAVDAAGRVTTPDLHLIQWRGSGVFRAAVAIEIGDSILVRLFSPQGVELAQASLGDAAPLVTRDQLGRPYLVLEAPSLPPGSYVLALSHGRPGTRLDVFLPAGATANGATTSEEFLRDYLWTADSAEPEALPSSPVRLGLPAHHDGTTVLSLFTERGVNYRVEVTASLATPRWQTLRYLSGDGRMITFSDQSGARQRFYRVRIGGE